MDSSLQPPDARSEASGLFQQAVQRHRGGAPGDAERLYRAALTVQPDHAGALRGLGAVLIALGRPQEALASYDRALAREPRSVEALNGRGNALMRLGRPQDALASYDETLALNPAHVSALSNRGAALRDLERPAEALASYDRALAIRPDHVWSLNNRGVALVDLRRPAEALASFGRALALKPDYAQALNNRGKTLASYQTALDLALGEAPEVLQGPGEALASFERAIALDPSYAEAHDNRGLLLFDLGRTDEAAAAFERAVALAPGRVRYRYHLSEARRLELGDPHLDALEDLARDMAALTADEQIDLNFALAKALADNGDHARAFGLLLAGNALKRRQTDYDEATSLGALERTQAAFTAELMARSEGLGDPSAVPVFIVGMPRSGTTLVEQILASHPEVFAAGEIDTFNQAVTAHGGLAAATAEDASRLPEQALRRIGAAYADRTLAVAPAARRITNKRPDNFRHAGLIHMALPNARIVHTRRNPVDTCLSCFSKPFGDDMPYASDLGELGRYYRAYEGLMAHWRVVLPPGVMLEVRYEDVIADPEGQTRRILDHCGLEWDARCLDFHLTERRVRTASAVQVRQPLYTSAIGRWRPYAPFLEPLLDALGPDRRGE